MNKIELSMKNESLKSTGNKEIGKNSQYGEVLNLVLEEAKIILINDKVGNMKRLLIILSGLIFSVTSGATLAYGEILLGMIGSILAVTVIEMGFLL